MNLRSVITGTLLLVGSGLLFLDSSLITTRPPLLAGSIVGMATLVGAVILGSTSNGRSA